MPTLILTPRFTEDAQALWRAAGQLGWGVERLSGWRMSEELRAVPEPVLYLEALFGPSLAEQFGLRLLEPPVDWLPRLPEGFRKRRVSLMPLRAARLLTEPAFIKPPNDKSFPARVYTGAELPVGYDEDSPVLVAEVVRWEVEFRFFVLDRRPRAGSVYLRGGELQREQGFAATGAELADAAAMVQAVCADSRVDLPRAAVLDVGVIAGRGWAVVEQNAAWGAGIYGCDPAAVLEVLRHAAVPVKPGAAPEGAAQLVLTLTVAFVAKWNVGQTVEQDCQSPKPRAQGNCLSHDTPRGPIQGMRASVQVETTIPSYLTAWPSRDLLRAAHQQVTREQWDRRGAFELFISPLFWSIARRATRPPLRSGWPPLRGCRCWTKRVRLTRSPSPWCAGCPSHRGRRPTPCTLHAADHGMHYLRTWNCTHIANATLRRRIQVACRAPGCEPPLICTPQELSPHEEKP